MRACTKLKQPAEKRLGMLDFYADVNLEMIVVSLDNPRVIAEFVEDNASEQSAVVSGSASTGTPQYCRTIIGIIICLSSLLKQAVMKNLIRKI